MAINIQKFKSERANELRILHKILQDKLKLNPSDISPLLAASKRLEGESKVKSEDNTWGYYVNGLIIPIKNTKHIEPKGLNALRLRIDYNVIGDVNKWGEMEDPFTEYGFSMTLYGEANGKKYSLSWHIDRDVAPASVEHHPLYHIHYSDGLTHLQSDGNNQSYDWGNAIYLDCPRLTHHPVDLILGIGLCITNFHPKTEFDKLIREPQFTIIYRKSQEAILKPYYHNIASNWAFDLRNVKWKDCKALCPQII